MNPRETPAPSAGLCSSCHHGFYQEQIEDYVVPLRNGDQCVVSHMEYLRCERCGHGVIPWASVERIDRAVADHTGILSPEKLRSIRLKLNPNEASWAESIGVGEETWRQWENGQASMSRYMVYFIRAIDRFPEMYRWVAERTWQK